MLENPGRKKSKTVEAAVMARKEDDSSEAEKGGGSGDRDERGGQGCGVTSLGLGDCSEVWL